MCCSNTPGHPSNDAALAAPHDVPLISTSTRTVQ